MLDSEELIHSLRHGINNRRLLEVASVVVLETDNGYFILKTRYGKHQTREMMYNLRQFTVFSSGDNIEYYAGENVLIKEEI